MYDLEQFVNNPLYIKNGSFQTLGSATATYNSNLLCYASTLSYLKSALKNPHISCIITTPALSKYIQNKAFAVVDEPDIVYGEIANQLILSGQMQPTMDFYIDKSAQIHPTANVSSKCKIGQNVIIGRNAIIDDYTILDDNVIIGDNVVIGCEGFYFKRTQTGELMKFLHAGGVHLHKNVEVMTGSIIQRAHDADFTSVGEGTKISVNVNIGHSSQIGKHNMITGNVQIAGRVTIGNYCWIGTSVTISDSVKIANYAKVKIGSVVIKDVKENQTVSGNFAYEHSKHLKNCIQSQR